MADEPTSDRLSTDELMAELRRQIRTQRADGSLYRLDAEAIGDLLLNEAIEEHELGAEFAVDPSAMKLRTHFRVESHRPFLGAPIVFVKRALIMPLFRWLVEHSVENAQRQQDINKLQLTCLRALALENAKLRRDLEELRADDD